MAPASAYDQMLRVCFRAFSQNALTITIPHTRNSYSLSNFFTFLFSRKTVRNSVKDKNKIIKKRTAFSISPPACVYTSIFKTTFRQSIRISSALKDIFQVLRHGLFLRRQHGHNRLFQALGFGRNVKSWIAVQPVLLFENTNQFFPQLIRICFSDITTSKPRGATLQKTALSLYLFSL